MPQSGCEDQCAPGTQLALSESHRSYCLLSPHTGLFLHCSGKAQILSALSKCGEKLRARRSYGVRSHLYRVPSPQASPQHQVESILIPACGALLCKGQEGVRGGHIEQGWDPVGDPSPVFLLEQRAVEGARCHFFHDLCKDRRQLNGGPYPNAGMYTSSALSVHFGRSREAEMDSNAFFFFFPNTKGTWSQEHKAGNTHSHLTNLPTRLCGTLMQPVFKCLSRESAYASAKRPSLDGL